MRDIEIGIGELSQEYGRLAADAVQKRVTYDVEYAKALLSIKVGDGEKMIGKEKEAKALLEVATQFAECRIAESQLDACKRRLSALESQLSAIQSRGKILQIERDLDRYTT